MVVVFLHFPSGMTQFKNAEKASLHMLFPSGIPLESPCQKVLIALCD